MPYLVVEKSETSSQRGPSFMFLGCKLRNCKQIQSEEFFLQTTRFLQRELNFVDRSGSLSYLGLKLGHSMKKVENHCANPSYHKMRISHFLASISESCTKHI